MRVPSARPLLVERARRASRGSDRPAVDLGRATASSPLAVRRQRSAASCRCASCSYSVQRAGRARATFASKRSRCLRRPLVGRWRRASRTCSSVLLDLVERVAVEPGRGSSFSRSRTSVVVDAEDLVASPAGPANGVAGRRAASRRAASCDRRLRSSSLLVVVRLLAADDHQAVAGDGVERLDAAAVDDRDAAERREVELAVARRRRRPARRRSSTHGTADSAGEGDDGTARRPSSASAAFTARPSAAGTRPGASRSGPACPARPWRRRCTAQPAGVADHLEDRRPVSSGRRQPDW